MRLHVKLNFDENSANDRSKNYLVHTFREFLWVCPIAELWCQTSRIRRDLGSYFRTFWSKTYFSSYRCSMLRIFLVFSHILILYVQYIVSISVLLLVGHLNISGKRGMSRHRVTSWLSDLIVSKFCFCDVNDWPYNADILITNMGTSTLCLMLINDMSPIDLINLFARGGDV